MTPLVFMCPPQKVLPCIFENVRRPLPNEDPTSSPSTVYRPPPPITNYILRTPPPPIHFANPSPPPPSACLDHTSTQVHLQPTPTTKYIFRLPPPIYAQKHAFCRPSLTQKRNHSVGFLLFILVWYTTFAVSILWIFSIRYSFIL